MRNCIALSGAMVLAASAANSATNQIIRTSDTDSPPVAITSHAITAADYPIQSVRLGEQGTVAVQYQIDETGAVVECAVTRSSGLQRLDQAACAVVVRWKFTPATQAGKPV